MTRVLAVAVLGAALMGCGGGSKSVKGEVKADSSNKMSAMNDKTIRVDLSRCKEAGKRIIKLDMNNDESPDIWKLVSSVKAKGTTVDVVTCKRVDFNHDGKPDMMVAYDDQQAVLIEHFDLDFDGSFDQMSYYERGEKIRVEWDTAHDSKKWNPDVYDTYRNNRIDLRARDTDRNGKPDYWERYKDGNVEAIGYDLNGDEKVDRWDQAERKDDAGETSPITGTGGTGDTGDASGATPAEGTTPVPAPAPAKPKTK